MRHTWIAWALTLGFALTFLAGPAASVATTDRAAGTSQVGATEAWAEAADHPDEVMVLGLAVRWGYLHNPTVAAFDGRWHFDDARDRGVFFGHWRTAQGHHGTLRGSFSLPDDGRGHYRGEWEASDSRAHGFLEGAWARLVPGHGVLDGKWWFEDGRPGGAMAGHWAARSDDDGVFRGQMIRAPSLKPVSWDGFLQTTDGAVSVHHTVRWEAGGHRHHGGGDLVYPQTDRQVVEWRSTTTTNWDGLVFVLRIPKVRPVPHVTLHTDQATFVWDATEIPGLHVRERVDRFGHAIEVRGFVVDREGDREVARMDVMLRWGMLGVPGRDGPGDPTGWDGGARISEGHLAVRRVLSFERGDALRRAGPQAVLWHSTTTTGWDGVLLRASVPLDRVDDATFHVRAGSFEHTFAFTELPGAHVFDVDDRGNRFQVRAVRR